ncbi:hypothetical protein MKX01_038751 [Papaver californicum]|nr:hypothetical protein MKX01_038751 [Papaver californicum]
MGALRTPLVCKFLLISVILVGLSSISIANASKVYVVGGTKLWNFGVPILGPFVDHSLQEIHLFSGYKSCKATARKSAKALWTGKDKFTLKKGNNYFICGIPGHCSAGMKIKVFSK